MPGLPLTRSVQLALLVLLAAFLVLIAWSPLAAAAPAASLTGSWSFEPARTKVVGGTGVTPAEYDVRYRSLAYVYISRPDGTAGACGGVVVAPDRVLTAAHCMRNVADVHVATGVRDFDVDVTTWTHAREFAVHPGWTGTGGVDAAILVLDGPVAAPVATIVGEGEDDLWGRGRGRVASPDTGLWVAGWGRTDAAAATSLPRALQQTLLHARADADCSVFALFVPTSSMCVGAATSSPCSGDSGGPVFGIVAGVPRVVGLVSGGDPACGYEHSVATRVAALRPWLAEHGATISTGTWTAPAGTIGGGGTASAASTRKLAIRSLDASAVIGAGRRTGTFRLATRYAAAGRPVKVRIVLRQSGRTILDTRFRKAGRSGYNYSARLTRTQIARPLSVRVVFDVGGQKQVVTGMLRSKAR